MEKTDLRYEIDDTNTIRMWIAGQELPFILQPHWPNGENFATYEDAKLWADAKIEELTDAEAPMAPAYLGEPPQKNVLKIMQEREEARQSAIAKFEALGITAEEVQAFLSR